MGTTEEHAGSTESAHDRGATDAIIESTLRELAGTGDAELGLQTACLRPVTPDGAVTLGGSPALTGHT